MFSRKSTKTDLLIIQREEFQQRPDEEIVQISLHLVHYT